MADLPLSKSVPKIYVPSLSVPHLKAKQIYVPKLEVPGSAGIRIPKRPRQHVDDLGDLILGVPFIGTLELQHTLEDYNLDYLKHIPLLNRIAGAGILIKEQFLDPMSEGDFTEAGINTLAVVGKSLDIVANPVKSLMPWAGGGTRADLMKSMGWLPESYRKDYQWDTGNFLVDLAGEIISDPLNWFSYGGKQIAKGAIDEVVNAYRKTLIKEYGEQIVKDLPDDFIRKIIVDTSDDLVDDAGEIVHRLVKRVEENRAKWQDDLLKVSKKNPNYSRIQDIIKQYDDALTVGKHFDLMDSIADIRFTDGFRKYNAARSLTKAVNNIENKLLLTSLGLNPLVSGSALLMTKVIMPQFKAIWNSAVKRLHKIDVQNLMNNSGRSLKETNEYIALKTKAIHKATYDKFNKLLTKYSYDAKKLQNLYMTIANSVPPSKLSTPYVNQLFLDKLMTAIPELRNIYNKEAKNFLTELGRVDLEELVNAVSDGGVTAYTLEQKAFREFKEYLEKDMAEFWNSPVKELKDYEPLARLKYIDEHLLPIQGRNFSIANLKEALTYINSKSPDMYVRIAGLLDYAGVNLNNYTQVATLLHRINSGDTAAVKKLQQLLTKNRTGALLQLETTVESQRALRKYFHAVEPKLNFGGDIDEDAVFKFFNNEANNKSAELYAKTYTDINDKLIKETDNIIKVKQDITDTLTNGITDLDEMFLTLDDIENYAGAEYTTSELFRNVLDFNTSKVDLESIKTFSDNLERLQRNVSMWHQRIINAQVEVPKQYAAVIADLNNLLRKAPIEKTINNFRDIYNMGDSFYRLMVSQQGMYALMELNIMADMPTQWLKELSDIGSDTRVNLQHISTMLRRQASSLNQDLSRALDDILTTIDSTNCLYTLLDKAEYLTTVKLPKEQVDFIKGMLFNVVYENKTRWVARVLEHPELLTQRFLKEFEGHNRQTLLDFFEEQVSKVTLSPDEEILSERMDSLRRAIEEGTATDAMYDEYDSLKYLDIRENVKTASDLYDELIKELSVNVSVAFDEYATALSKLQDLTGNELSFGNFFTNTTVAHMNELGLNYNEIIEALAKEGATEADFITATDFITRVSGNVLQPELDKAKQVIKDFMAVSGDGKQLDELLEYQLKELADNTLARTITKTFQEIDELNSYLSGNNAIVGKLRNRYGTLNKIKNHLGYVSVEKFNEYVRTISSFRNSYGWSTANGFLAVKKDFDPLFIKQHNLTADVLRGVDAIENVDDIVRNNMLNREYVLFYNAYKDAYKYVSDYAATNLDYVKKARKALTEVFSDNAVSWGPIDPTTYFLAANDTDILAWDAVASNQSMSRRVARNYAEIKKKARMLDSKNISLTIEDQIKQYKNPAGLYTDVRNMLDNNVLLEEDAWDEYVESVMHTKEDIVFDGVREDLSRYIKDPESLQRYKRDFENYIRNDIEALDNTQIFAELGKDTRAVRELLENPDDQRVLGLLKSYGIKPDTLMNDEKVLKFLKAERTEALADTIRSLNADQLRYYVDKNTAGILFFVNNKPEFTFNFTESQLKRAGLKIELLKDTDNVFVIYRTNNTPPTASARFKYKQPKSVFKITQQQITDSFKANRNYFYWDGMDLPDEIFTGEMMNKEVYDAILTDKRITDLLKQNPYSKSGDLLSNNFYTKKISRPNLAVVGTSNAYNTILDTFTDTLTAKNIMLNYQSTRIDKTAWRGSIAAIKRVNTEHKYLQLFLNDDYSLGSPMFRRVLSDATDEQLKDLFKRNNFDACIVRANNKGQPTVYKIYIENQKQLADAIEAGAIMVPHDIYRNMVLSVNKHTVSSKLLNVYRNTIVATFKTIYLTSPGFLMRNALDSLFYKNLSSTEGMASLVENFKYEYRASRMLKQYDDIVRRAIDLSAKEQGTATFNRFYLKRVLETVSEDERIAFRLTDVFMNSSASSGLTESLQEFLLNYNMKDAVLNEYAWETWYKKYILNNPYVTGIQSINDHIEKTARYGLFLNLVDNGTDLTDAIRRVINTHFDYQIKEPGVDLLEQIFWFSTFPINNMFYYMNEGLTRNPDMLKLQMDALELSWNDGTYTWDEIKNSDYLMYNALTGNIRFEWNGKQIVLKTGSSVLDFFKLMFNPVGEATDRLNPFLSVLVGLEEADQLNPLSTITNRVGQIKSGRSYLPSVYAELYGDYPKRHYIERAPYVKRTWSYPKTKRNYFKKPDNMKRMKYLFTTDRYYFGKGKNLHRWLDSTTSIEPHWYINNYRHYKFNKNYKSLSKAMKLYR